MLTTQVCKPDKSCNMLYKRNQTQTRKLAAAPLKATVLHNPATQPEFSQSDDTQMRSTRVQHVNPHSAPDLSSLCCHSDPLQKAAFYLNPKESAKPWRATPIDILKLYIVHSWVFFLTPATPSPEPAAKPVCPSASSTACPAHIENPNNPNNQPRKSSQ